VHLLKLEENHLVKIATPENHFLPDCVCAPLHSACTQPDQGSPQSEPAFVDVTLDQIRHSAQQGCWFCSVVYGGITAAPPWDPERPEEIPVLPWFRMPSEKMKFDRPGFAIKALGDGNHTQEPRLVFYVDSSATSSPCEIFLVRTEPVRTDPHR